MAWKQGRVVLLLVSASVAICFAVFWIEPLAALNVIERLTILCDGTDISADQLAPGTIQLGEKVPGPESAGPYRRSLEAFEHFLVVLIDDGHRRIYRMFAAG